MRIRVFVVPRALMPDCLETASWPTPDGIEIYLADLLSDRQRTACVDAIAGAYLRRRAAMAA